MPHTFNHLSWCPDRQFVSRQPCRGFTLIELMVVMAIIAMMTAMMLPAIGLVKDSAKITSCSSRLRQMHVCFENYLGLNDGMYPYWSDGTSNSQSSNFVYQITVEPNFARLLPGPTYFASSGLAEYANIFNCSEDTHRLNDIIPSGPGVGYLYLDQGSTSHGWNSFGLGFSDGCAGQKGGSGGIGRLRSQVTHPDNTILSCDTRRPPNLTGSYPGNPGDTNGYCRTDAGVYPRHKRETICNVLWVDGHISQVRANGTDQVSRVNSLWNAFGGRAGGSCYDSSRP